MKRVRIIWNVDGRRRTQTFNVQDDATREALEDVVNRMKALTTRQLEEAFIVDFTAMNV